MYCFNSSGVRSDVGEAAAATAGFAGAAGSALAEDFAGAAGSAVFEGVAG